MFTGIVETTGEIIELGIEPSPFLRVHAPEIARGTVIGESVAVNGCCLTVVSQNENELRFDLLAETLSRTNLGALYPGDRVNLERALSATGRLGGHFVQGHIDVAGRVVALDQIGNDWRLECDLAAKFSQYVIEKGSIAINGVSLTIAKVGTSTFVTWIIPHTFSVTNFQTLKPGGLVNLEFDLLAKYVERIVVRGSE